MRRVFVPLLLVGLFASTVAHAQFGGGGHEHQRGGATGGSPAPSAQGSSSTPRASTPADQVEIVGVVTALGPEPDRVTISYDAVEGLNWPAGTTLFVASKPELLQGMSVGEKVRFKLESQHIYQIKPF